MERKKRMMKRGILFSLDAGIAIIMIASIIMIIPFMENKTANNEIPANDFIDALSNLKVKEANYQAIKNLTVGNKTKDQSVLELIGEYWAQNDSETARNILMNLSEGIFPDTFRVEFEFDNSTIYNKTSIYDIEDNTFIAKRYISGITENQTVKGISARAYLTYIDRKPTSTYVFFGGFVGEGNITRNYTYLPDDANVTYMGMDFSSGSSGSLFINNNECANFTEVNISYMNITNCSNYLIGGMNNFTFLFNGSVENNYIGGGMIEIRYFTSEIKGIENSSTYYFPGIKGIINLYSSIDVLGNLTYMDAYLHYKANHSEINNATLFFTIGNKTIYQNNHGENETNVSIDNSTLSSLLNYSEISLKTVPIRVGFMNLSKSIIVKGGNADVVLITDLSGSMDRCVENNNACNGGCTCRIDLAKELEKNFTNSILNVSGNRIGLVTYSQNANEALPLGNNESQINNTIDGFSTGGATCACCAIREARLMLETESNSSRSKYIIFMTDGIGNIECDNNDMDNTNGCNYFWCGGWFWCNCPQYESVCGGCITYDSNCGDYISLEARNDAVNDSCYAHNATGATIDTIGFGAGANGCAYAQTFLEDMAICGNGNNYSSSNTSGLSEIYGSIAEDIIVATQISQKITIDTGVVNTILYPDSHIDFSFVPQIEQAPSGYIEFKLSTDYLDNCTSSFTLPNVTLSEAWMTSFSSLYWNDLLIVNGNTVFNLSSYDSNYSKLGDPHVITIPVDTLRAGENNIIMRNIGSSPDNSSGCLPHSRIIYKAVIPMTIPYSNVYESSEGCYWKIEYDGGDYYYANVPDDYAGAKTCEYSKANINYDANDAIDNAVYEMLKKLDFDSDRDVDIRINDFNIDTITVNEIPNLWGPSVFSIKITG